MIVLRVQFDGSIDPHPEFVAVADMQGQTPDEKDVLALWVRAFDSPEGVRRVRAALAAECARKGVSLASDWVKAGPR
jgi:hypothetical protein